MGLFFRIRLVELRGPPKPEMKIISLSLLIEVAIFISQRTKDNEFRENLIHSVWIVEEWIAVSTLCNNDCIDNR